MLCLYMVRLIWSVDLQTCVILTRVVSVNDLVSVVQCTTLALGWISGGHWSIIDSVRGGNWSNDSWKSWPGPRGNHQLGFAQLDVQD